MEDVSGLKSTLSKYKEKLKGLNDDQLAELRSVDLAEYKRLKAEAEKKGKGKGGDGEGDDEPAVAKLVEKRVAEAVAEFAPLKEEVEALRAENRELRIGSVIESAAIAAGVDPVVLKDVRRVTDHFFTINKAKKVVVLDEDGDETSMTPEKFFSDKFKKERPHYFKPTGSSGGGSGSDGEGGPKLTPDQLSSLPPAERLRIARRSGTTKSA